MIKADLHTHSFYSDGNHAPEFLLQRARENQVTHLAITDHDCIEAFAQLSDSGQQTGLQLMTGVEISCQWREQEVHVVGLGIDLCNADLTAFLNEQQQSRRQRLAKINLALEKLNIKGLNAYLDALPCVARTRSHVADFLVCESVCNNRARAFKKYLGKKGQAYQKSDWHSIEKSVQIINSAGGIAVLAHPNKYNFTASKLQKLLTDFKHAGGEAIEVAYPNIDSTTTDKLARLCHSFALWASCGSDFHSASATWTDVGKFVPFPQPCIKNAIWLHPRWHSLNSVAC